MRMPFLLLLITYRFLRRAVRLNYTGKRFIQFYSIRVRLFVEFASRGSFLTSNWRSIFSIKVFGVGMSSGNDSNQTSGRVLTRVRLAVILPKGQTINANKLITRRLKLLRFLEMLMFSQQGSLLSRPRKRKGLAFFEFLLFTGRRG